MPEATIQQLTTVLPGEEPFIGDLVDGELAVNTADGRIWSGDPIGTPVELGGAVKNSPIGALTTANYLEVDMTSPDSLPISNTNPLDIPSGYYREHRILLKFPTTPLTNFSSYFDYPVNWGADSNWKESQSTWGGDLSITNVEATNPIDFYKGAGVSILIELSSFGPGQYWIGRLLWVGTLTL